MIAAKFKMDKQQGLLYSTLLNKLSSMSCGSLDGKGVWGRMDTCICIPESLCCAPETTTTLLTDYTLIQTKELKNKLILKRIWLLLPCKSVSMVELPQ